MGKKGVVKCIVKRVKEVNERVKTELKCHGSNRWREIATRVVRTEKRFEAREHIITIAIHDWDE